MKLRVKILSFVLSLTLLSATVVIWMARNSVDTVLINQVTQLGLSESLDLSEKMAKNFETRNEILLLQILEETRNTTHASYVMALDKSGVVLAHTDVAEKGKTYHDPLSRQMLEENSPRVRIEQQALNSIVEISAPIWKRGAFDATEQFLVGDAGGADGKEQIGIVRLGIPLDDTLVLRNKIILRMAGIMALIGFMALVLTVLLTNRFMRPVRFLAQGTAQISNGAYGTHIPVFSKDELGALATDFNRMSDVLAATTVSKDFLSDVFEKMQDALMIVDSQGYLRMANHASANLLGYGEHELIGKSIETIFTETPSLESGSVMNVDACLLAKNGNSIAVLYSISQFNNKGEWILVARDVRDRKQLEKMVLQSEKMSAVGQLAAGVAHEINNPLGIILGFAQAVARRLQPNDPLALPLQSIEREATRCKNLVQDLLTFSRVSKVEREPLDLNKTLESCLSLLMSKAKVAQININTELAPDLPKVLANSNQIQQVAINLVNNAVDALTKGGTVTITTTVLNAAPLSWVCLKVTDTGMGIPAEILGRIFEPFFTTKGVGKGTGLGLSLVHEIVSKHSGTIDVESRPGFTEFLVKLPARCSPSDGDTHA